MPKAKKQKRSILAPVLALLLVLALAGTLLFSAFRDKIERWEYPQRFTEYVEYYAGKYGIDPMIYTPSSAPRAILIRTRIPMPGPGDLCRSPRSRSTGSR